jgi:hypothetical protein
LLFGGKYSFADHALNEKSNQCTEFIVRLGENFRTLEQQGEPEIIFGIVAVISEVKAGVPQNLGDQTRAAPAHTANRNR